jgi:tetratricopeptide (TPR) repeat protein
MRNGRDTSNDRTPQAVIAFAFLFAMFAAPQRGFAQLGTMTMSDPKSGLQIKSEWLSVSSPSGGYLPIQLEVTSTRGPRELQVVVQFQNYPGGLEVTQAVSVEANKPANVTMLVPVSVNHLWGELRVYEQGAELDKMRQWGIGGGSFAFRGEPAGVLVIGRSVPDWRVFEQTVNNAFGSQGQTLQHSLLPPDKAPRRWIEYTTLDLVLTSLSDLERMSSESREALVSWALAGGNVAVWGVANNSDLARLDVAIDLKNRPPVGVKWRQPKPEDQKIIMSVQAASNSASWNAEALTRLEQQGIDVYRAYCSDLLQRFGNSLATDADRNNLAWSCVLGPDAVSDMSRIVQFAQRAVASNSSNAAYVNTLGAALYRAGRYEEAIDKLQRSMSLNGGQGIPEDWFFLAMAYYKLGEKEKGQEWLTKAVQRAAGSGSAKPEWKMFRREADALWSGKEAADAPAAANRESKPAPTTGAPSSEPTGDSAISKIDGPFAVRPFGFGQLIRVSADPFPGTDLSWAWLFNSIGTGRLRWSERHGMTARAGNWDFWNFLISDVGRAPVGAFQILITVFALIIGPLNYFFLRNRRRLYLMILTVPLLALVTSGALFGYSLASDGFAVRTRVRSVTRLDQNRSEGVSLSRISYYAGLAPAGGLHFSTDTAVYPLDPDDEPSGYRVLHWTEQQNLTSGWLQSRTPAQLLTISARPMGEHLVIATDVAGALRITNNLGAAIQLLVLCDADGALYTLNNLGVGVRATAGSESSEAAKQLVRELIGRQRLETPQEIQDRAARGPIFPWSPRYYQSREVTAVWGSGLLEEALRQVTSIDPSQPFLLPKTYLAITERPPFLELGVPSTRDEGSLYVILGSY